MEAREWQSQAVHLVITRGMRRVSITFSVTSLFQTVQLGITPSIQALRVYLLKGFKEPLVLTSLGGGVRGIRGYIWSLEAA